MKETLEQRLKELKDEYASGTKVMAELQNKQNDLQATLLRISGAIQVLEEMLGRGSPEKSATDGTSPD
ncbi:MAG: hypothetical protein IH605_21430 [Burkholderiales bacterium]|nr:hypothetical protein [Burkholderiales bacterium]